MLIRALTTGLAFTAAAMALAADAPSTSPALATFIGVFDDGDQTQFERYLQRAFSAASIANTPAAERADRLARLFTDTHGFDVERMIGSTPDRELALVRARMTGTPYCLELKRDSRSGQVEDVIASPLPSEDAAGQEAGPAEVRRKLAALLARLAAADEFSGVVVITKDGRTVLRRAYGRADLAGMIPITFRTRFNIASMGKMITGIAVGQLLADGRLRLEQTVGELLPDYPDAAIRDHVTVRQLLTHTSGLGPKAEYVNDPAWPDKRAGLLTVGAYLPLIRDKPLEAEPGERYEYSNSGYIILGLIIERVTGRSFYDYVRRHVLRPAGMNDSLYHARGAPDRNVATPLTRFVNLGRDDYHYRLGPRRNAETELAARGGPQGGLFATADDMTRFLIALAHGRLVDPAIAKLLTSSQGVGRRPPEIMTGLGFEIVTRNGTSAIGHTGGDIGVSAFAYRLPAEGYTIVALSNYDPRAIPLIWRRMQDIVSRKPAALSDGAIAVCRLQRDG